MSDKKLSSLSPEELLKALEETKHTETVTLEVVPPVLEFLNRFAITAGNNYITSASLRRMFEIYYPDKLSVTEFAREIQLYLPYNVKTCMVGVNKELVFILEQILKLPTKRQNKKNELSSERKQKHYESFINAVGVTRGPHKIKSNDFYDIYAEYCKKRQTRPFSKRVFWEFSKFYFSHKRGSQCVFYLVDQNTANIPKKEQDGVKKSNQEKKDTKKSV